MGAASPAEDDVKIGHCAVCTAEPPWVSDDGLVVKLARGVTCWAAVEEARRRAETINGGRPVMVLGLAGERPTVKHAE